MDSDEPGEHDRTVVRALRSLGPPTAPTTDERARMRVRLLAALDAEDASTGGSAAVPEIKPSPTPRLVTTADDTKQADSEEANPPPSRAKRSGATSSGKAPAGRGSAGRRPGTRDESRRSVMAGVRGRFAVAAVAVLALVGSLAGMSLLLARDALPGDALYGVKRTGEAASLGLTFGDEPKALKHLEFAAARVSEIETLARRYPRPGDAPVGGYLTALTDFDNDAAAGSRQLITLATRTDGRLLESLRDWATQQGERLRQTTARLPDAARDRQATSLALLDKITTRSETLSQRMHCYRITSGSHDDVGATPATGPCEQGPRVEPGLTSSTVPSPRENPETPAVPAEPTGADVPLPPVEPTPELPPVPVPGVTESVPAPEPRPGIELPIGSPSEQLPPLIDVPALLPDLPGLGVG